MRKDWFRKVLVLSIAIALVLLAGCGKDEETVASGDSAIEESVETTAGGASESTETGAEASDAAITDDAGSALSGEADDLKEDGDTDYPGTPYAEITIRNYGTVKVRLEPEEAPITVKNFIDLAESGFYDGLTFHRIMDGFMMQGGDPDGNGTGGSDKNITGEFALNGIENNISHTKGTISMARSQDPNSASSQFFIVQSDSTFLDGQYAGFGYVTEGIEIVDQICADARPIDNNGTIPTAVQPVMESVKITYE